MVATDQQPSFALLTEELLLLPTPSSALVRGYRDLFRRLHADTTYCQVAFGDGFKAVVWSDEEVKDFLDGDAIFCWAKRGMGDFAVGTVPAGSDILRMEGRMVEKQESGDGQGNAEAAASIKIILGPELERLMAPEVMDTVSWVGYTCVRDATTSMLVDLYPEDEAASKLPPWQEMVEVRYGLSSEARGTGIATRSTSAVMRWAIEEHQVRRFIAETERDNAASARTLRRMGFVHSGTSYFQDENEVEWEKLVVVPKISDS